MHLSLYLKIWPYPAEPGHSLLYSTRKASLALVPDEVVAQLRAGQGPADYVDTLVGLGMLVADLDEERREVRGFLAEVNRVNPVLRLAIILGLDCNFSCTYCYEGSMKGKTAMGDAVADQLVVFVKDRLRPGKKRITLDFYGGEPLLYTQQIKRIAGALKPFAEERGVEFRFSLVTNGSLLTPRLAEELVPYGLYGAKVTVDGPGHVHNRMRPFKNGRPSLDLILKNLADCADLVRIGLGGNYTAETFCEFPELFDLLATHGLTPERLGLVGFAPVGQTADQYANPEFNGGCRSSSEPWVAAAANRLREETLLRGYKTAKPGPSPCMVDVADAFTVHYNGKLFKCIAMIGHEQFSVGDIWQGAGDYRTTYNLDHWKHSKECRDCTYLPLCFGGCRHMRFQRNGDMAEVDCQKEFFDRTLEPMIRQDVTCRPRAGG